MKNSHTNIAKIFHWGFILLYCYGLLKQLNDLSQLEDPNLLAFEVIFASLFLFIVLIRYFYMRRFETFLGAYEPIPLGHKFVAKVIHKSMYLCLALLPLSGLLIAGLFQLGAKSGILQNLAIALHEFSAFLSYVLISTHIAAAIYSRLRRKGIWTSMVPLWSEVKVISPSRTKTKALE